MATKIDPAPSAKPRRVQSTVSVSSSPTVSASTPKVSMFGAKSGFVIPKNKLSGSLVPIFRGGGKVEAGDSVKEESTKQIQRKTKWGTDLTQDAAVRKARALAYQTRVEQITQQLKSGVLKVGDHQGTQSPKLASNDDSASHLIDNEAQKFELLELERREIIGEILRLNPSYKAPPDYKPLLKEAKVRIPLKVYPGYNFIVLLLGPESKTQKRLEEETGAKIRVHGTKADTGEKCEITQSDMSEAQGTYEELYVNVSADTYEKVDAAVALIELLVTPVAGNSAVALTNSTSVAGDHMNILDPSQKDSSSGYIMVPAGGINQGVSQPILIPAQSGPPQFQPYPGSWFPIAPPNAPLRSPSGFMVPPVPTNSFRFPPSSISPFNVPPYFGRPPPFGSVPRTSSAVASRPPPQMQFMQQPLNQAVQPRNNPMPGQQPPSRYPVMQTHPSSTSPASFTASQPMPSGPMPATRPQMPLNSQLRSIAPMGPPPNRPMPPGNFSGWSTPPPVVPQHQRPNNMTQMAPPSITPPTRPPLAVPPTSFASVPSQLNVPANVASRPLPASFTPPATFPTRPTAPPAFSSVPPQIGPISAPAMVSSSSGAQLHAPMPSPRLIPSPVPSPVPRPLRLPVAAPAPIPGPTAVPQTAVMARPPVVSLPMAPGQAPKPAQLQVPSPQPPPAVTGSSSLSIPSFSPVKAAITSPIIPPPITAPKPQRPSSGDFTFQPLRVQVPASPTTPRPSSQSVAQNTSHVPFPAPQAPSFRPALQNPAPPVGTQGFPRPPAVNQMGPSQVPIQPPSPSVSSPSINQSTIRPPPRLPTFPNTRPIAPIPQVGPPNFSPAPQAPNLPSILSVRPVLQPHHNQLPPTNRSGSLTVSNQQLSNHSLGYMASRPVSSPGANQIYDPFSPTSVSSVPSRQGGDPAKKPETDAEYEDLMASVGVR